MDQEIKEKRQTLGEARSLSTATGQDAVLIGLLRQSFPLISTDKMGQLETIGSAVARSAAMRPPSTIPCILSPHYQLTSVAPSSTFLPKSQVFGRLKGVRVSESSPQPVSALLIKWRAGDQEALQALIPLVYQELRLIAQRQLRQERPDHTLQSTALVHEAYLRLMKQGPVEIEHRPHFLAVASRLMRQILVDHARGHRAAKRGSGLKLELNDAMNTQKPQNMDLVDLDDALNELAKLDPQQSRIVELRYFGGLSIDETAEIVGVSSTTVKREWVTARAWLRREVRRTGTR